jgi:DUF4097 and DUF4098 domain-containing protein YvlB
MRALPWTPVLAAVLVVAAASSPSVAAAGQRTETERVTRQVALEAGGTVRLKNFSGKVTITGTSESGVSVDAVRRAPRERLDHIKLDVQTSGSTVTIDANKNDSWLDSMWGRNNVVETELTVRVPTRTNLDVAVFSSPVTVSHVTGRHEVHGFSSSLQLNDVSGRVRAHTFSGAVRVQLAAAEDQPELDLDTFSGDIDVRLPERAHANLTFTSFSGDLQSDLPLTLTRTSRRNVHGTLNGGDGHDMRFKTFSGDVKISRP